MHRWRATHRHNKTGVYVRVTGAYAGVIHYDALDGRISQRQEAEFKTGFADLNRYPLYAAELIAEADLAEAIAAQREEQRKAKRARKAGARRERRKNTGAEAFA